MNHAIRLAAVPLLILGACGNEPSGSDAPPAPPALGAEIAAGDYAGTYERTDGTPIHIVPRGGGLIVVVTGLAFSLVPTGTDTFDLDGVPERVTFERDAGGTVVAVSDSQGRYPRVGDVPPDLLSQYGDGDAPGYAYTAPTEGEDDLPVGAAGGAGLDEAALAGIGADLRGDPGYAGVHALLVMRDGILVHEDYLAGFDADQPHDLRSATKSIIAALVGVAVARGDASLDDRPLAVVAEAAGLPVTDHKASLTLRDLLGMRHGLRCDDWDEASPGNEASIYPQDAWTPAILAIPDDEDARRVSYCSGMPLMVGRYLELQTGQPLPDYAQATLFGPLGIDRSDWKWDFRLEAKETLHGAQAHLRPRDMLRIGRLYAEDGVAPDGTQVLPEGWVAETFAATEALGDWRRYARYWWTYEADTPDGPVPVHFASGIGGQRIAVVPSRNLVIAMTGGSFTEGQGGPRRVIERIVAASGD